MFPYRERIQSKISRKKSAWAKSEGNPVRLSKSLLPVRRHLIPPAMSYDRYVKCCSLGIGKGIRVECARFSGGWLPRYPLLATIKIPGSVKENKCFP